MLSNAHQIGHSVPEYTIFGMIIDAEDQTNLCRYFKIDAEEWDNVGFVVIDCFW